MEKLVAIHKELNRCEIPFYREKALDFFGEIMKKWNTQKEYKPLIFNIKEFKIRMNLVDSKNNDYFNDFLDVFSKEGNKTWKIGAKEVRGNIFTIVTDKELETLEIHFNNYILEYLFTKKDIDLMKKNKKKLQMTTEELEKYKKNKKKYENLMLYSQADLLELTGKYNKRLYMLLIQFKDTGKFFMNYKVFKELLEIPSSYRASDIDKKILNLALEELKKADIFINKIIKNKQGGRDIKTIEIYFKYQNKISQKVNEALEKSSLIQSLEIENNISKEENQKIALEQIAKIKKNLKK